MTKMSPTKTGSMYGGMGGMGGMGGPGGAPQFGGGIKAILAAAGIPSKSGLTVGSAALNKLGSKGGTSQKSQTGKSYGTGSRRTGGSRSRKS